jgi:hypothetical protein
MRHTLALAIALAFALPPLGLYSSAAEAAKKSGGGPTSVRGHTRRDGTYVAPHKRSSPDKSRTNNWSAKGNANPYTGKKGTQDPYRPRPPKKPN